MTRKQIESEYSVDANGIIRSLGKFEAEMLYAPYFYDAMLNGESDHINSVDYFELSAEDKLEFPELIGSFAICLEESEQGFVYLHVFDTEAEYRNDALNQSKYGVD